MTNKFNKRHAERLWQGSRRWSGPTITGWFAIGPAMLLIAIVASIWMDITEITPFLTFVLCMVCCLGFLIWMYDGFFRLLDEKESEIERLRTQLAHGEPGNNETRRS